MAGSVRISQFGLQAQNGGYAHVYAHIQRRRDAEAWGVARAGNKKSRWPAVEQGGPKIASFMHYAPRTIYTAVTLDTPV